MSLAILGEFLFIIRIMPIFLVLLPDGVFHIIVVDHLSLV